MNLSRRSSRVRLFTVSLLTSALLAVTDAGAVKVDFLWVIDNSPSMAGEQAVLSSTASQIQDQLAHARCEVDWRMAVAYTDLHRAPTNDDVCAGAVGPGRRRVCPFTSDMDVFRQGTPECAYVMPGTCGDASERGFNAARVAIERLLAGQGCEQVPNASCELRPDANLSVIFMTDTGEQTPNDVPPPFQPDNSVSSWAGFFDDYDHFRPGGQRAQVHGLLCPVRPEAGDTTAPCSDKVFDPALYDRYSDLVRLMGGVEGSIRDDDQTQLPATIGMLVDATIAQACCGNGTVDPGEECDDGNGNNGDCCSSTCHLEPATTVCRPAAGPCDAAETCTGTSTVCPVDAKAASVCRAAAGACDLPESCDGSTNACPADRFVVDGTACNDGSACSRRDVCRAGVCAGEDPVTCTPRDQCHQAGTCDPATGQCSNPDTANGTTCDDGNGCTRRDACQAGSCLGADPVICTASDQCHTAGICNPATGVCSNPARVDNTTCDDGNACTREDACQAGSCRGNDPVVCSAQDSCHEVGTCDPSTGLCSNPVRVDGSSCDDGNACTRTDVCRAGSCLGQDPVTCTASDGCHLAGTCDPATGTCSNPPQVDGAACDDGSACTRQDACEGGRCVGADAVSCASPDQCHVGGTCSPATGVCEYTPRPDGSVCDDGSACTQGDSCWGGGCVGGPEVRCSAPDQCHLATACNPATGACAILELPDTTACNDGDPCTGNDTCWGGMGCKGTERVSCDDGNACTTDGCDRTTGCSNIRIEGLAGVTCLCDNGLDTLWCGDSVPSLIERPFAKACQVLRRAQGASAKRSRKLMIKAKKVLKKTVRAVRRAKKKHMITPDCAMDMFGLMGDATTRVGALATNQILP